MSREASDAEIKKSYRRQARAHHPDANPEDHEAEERFKELTEAYEVLSNPEARRAYDTYGHQVPRGAGAAGYPGAGDPFGGFQDIFEAFFGDRSFGGSFFGTSTRRARAVVVTLRSKSGSLCVRPPSELTVKSTFRSSKTVGSAMASGERSRTSADVRRRGGREDRAGEHPRADGYAPRHARRAVGVGALSTSSATTVAAAGRTSEVQARRLQGA